MKNITLAQGLLQSLWNFGVREVVLCAGARNAPFVACLSEPGALRVHSFFDERSAGFFALGRMQATSQPVVVITTSGTAAAELLPATIEADYQGLPLILLTADRPRHYRGSGAPQSIEQVGIYSHFVERTWDIEDQWSGEIVASGTRPLHLNVCFDEPLIDGAVAAFEPSAIGAASSAVASSSVPRTPGFATVPQPITSAPRSPLVIVGALPLSIANSVLPWLKGCGANMYLEAASQLRGHSELRDWELCGGEPRLGAEYDCVIRIGGVPTLRLWRDLENSKLPVFHFSHLPFSGLPRVPQVYPLAALNQWPSKFTLSAQGARQQDAQQSAKLAISIKQFPLSEVSWVQWLSQQLPAHSRLFLGNSLPIREWDLAALREVRPAIFVNRGVNGIDGLISTFLGVADAKASNWLLLGDLSALYDLSGPWAARALDIADLNVVILNNGGGKIFHRIFSNPLFENSHSLDFKAWAQMWGWDYLRLDQLCDLKPAVRPRVIEIVPDNSQSDAFWEALR